MARKKINEEMNLHEGWYKEARQQTLETLPGFMKMLITEYHDYGAICHAFAAAIRGVAWAMNSNDNCGGISRFQGSFIMWQFIKEWCFQSNKLGFEILDYDNLLYPKYADKFKNTISAEHWEKVQDEAKRLLSEKHDLTHPNVAHWQRIVDGKMPFDFELSSDESPANSQPTTNKPANDEIISYTQTKTLFCYRIERNYFHGNVELVCRISRALPDARKLAIRIAKSLSQTISTKQ